MGPPPPQPKIPKFGPGRPWDPYLRIGGIGGNRSPLSISKNVVIGPILSQKTVWPMYALVYPASWLPTAPGPPQKCAAHRGDSIPLGFVQIHCNRTDVLPFFGLAHVCSSFPSLGPEARGPGPGPGARSPGLGKLEHTWAKPFFGHKSVRLQPIKLIAAPPG